MYHSKQWSYEYDIYFKDKNNPIMMKKENLSFAVAPNIYNSWWSELKDADKM